MEVKELLQVLGYALAGLMFVYLVIGIISKKTVLISELITGVDFEADQFYHLPGGQLTIAATATVSLGMTAQKIVVNATLVHLSLDVKASIEPDTSTLVRIKYTSDLFSNDELSITTNAKSLLENVTISTEDRISHIITKIAEAPEAILRKGRLDGFIKEDAEVVQFESKVFTRTFVIPAESSGEPGLILEWTIPFPETADGVVKEVNASFRISNRDLRQKAVIPRGRVKGLFTRVLKTEEFDVHLAVPGSNSNDQQFQKEVAMSFNCLMPDVRRLVKIPMRRAWFVKKIQSPKFSNGVLVENTINKPSELEAFLSLPITIGKAFFSIPAALFQFRITQIRNMTEMEKAQTMLREVRAANKQEKPGENEPVPFFPVNDNGPRVPKLRKDTETSRRENIRKKALVATPVNMQNTGLESPPDPCIWADKVTVDWMHYQNDRLETCVPAAAAHQILNWRANALNDSTQVREADVLAAYQTACNYNPAAPASDQGCNVDAFLSHWKTNGLAGRFFHKHVFVIPGSINLLKIAVYWFGGCIIRLDMPLSAKRKAVWKYPSDTATARPQDDLAGSWGMHVVAVVGFSGDNFTVISCEDRILMTRTFYEKYNRQAVVILSKDWSSESVNSPTTPALSFAELSTALQTIETNFKV